MRSLGTLSWHRLRRLGDSAKNIFDFEGRRVDAEFQKLRAQYWREYWTDAARAVGAEIEDLGGETFRLRRGGFSTFTYRYQVQLDDHLTLKIAGNKPLTHRLLEEMGYRTPRFLEFSLDSLDAADRFRVELGAPVVVKPASGTGGGNGVTTGVDSSGAMRRASHRAAADHRRMLVEEQVSGDSYRVLYLDGQFVDIVRRDPPRVVADGVSTIAGLMRAETLARLQASPLMALHPLSVDLECDVALRNQGLMRSSVPEAGRSVIAKAVVNQNAARENHCVRDEVHPSIVQMGHEIVSAFGIELGGLDLLTPDITRPLDEVGGVINEVNTTPGLHHHALMSEESKRLPVGEMVLEHVFARIQERQAVALAREQVSPA